MLFNNIYVFLVIYIFAVFGIGNARKSTNDAFLTKVSACCQSAILAVKTQRNPNCKAIGRRASSGLICRTSAELCCVKQLQESLCRKGRSVAINGGSCDLDSTRYYGREDHQECCYCCYLGIEAKRKGIGCQTSAVLGFPCQNAFFKMLFNGWNGFELNVNGRTCNDVNECARGVVCNQGQACRNTYGSYECVKGAQVVTVAPTITCPIGLEVDPGRRQCRVICRKCRSGLRWDGRRCTDIDECNTVRNACPSGQSCENVQGSYRCRCPSGYTLRNSRCYDINECQRPGICQSNERCRNTAGSYKCVTKVNDCSRGYERVGGECVAIRVCGTSREDCSEHARCRNTGPGRYQCTCKRGYSGNGKNCQDIDECNTVRNACPSGQSCENVPGSYRCRCPRGYTLRNSRCYDIDECNTLRNACPSGQSCENVPGSYRCRCPSGYTLRNSRCYDIDECREGLCARHETCTNLPGTYRCEDKSRCDPGYRRQSGACVDVNECLDSRRCSSDQVCVNTEGSYECRVRCSSGYERDPSTNDCRDIDECAVGNRCGPNRDCRNLPGTFSCIRGCQPGYERNNGRCEDKDECLIYNICSPPRPVCENIPGSYRCNYRKCPDGFERRRDGRCHDIDECTTGRHRCRAKTEMCVNVNGTYSCRCNPGYYRRAEEVHCRDKDECSEASQYCQHNCVNTDGSFRCECRSGYKLADNTNCFDVNECREGISGCEQRCVNSQGSYRCECEIGYRLQRDKVSCVDIDECKQPREYNTGCKWKCENTMGGYRCSCPSGYEIYSQKFCVDIDECSSRDNDCGRDSNCVNTAGGHKCFRAICPNQRYYVKRSPSHCSRKICRRNDRECLRETRKSIRWYAQAFRNGAPAGAFDFSYNITTTGYRTKPRIKFSISRGNDGNVFEIINHSYGKSFVRNSKVLRGPKDFFLEYRGEVIYQGQVTATFITNLNVYVSQYDF
ncbi:fibrillin-1-like [Dendronephthya gigantea]|uniref:fibrillin-1-like n=1 Tax=Dendronephthya gigantea TaxID=151771 RepID=UPI00106A0FE0|nr:fibrillin-1-like [Dendronephthya gigantea]